MATATARSTDRPEMTERQRLVFEIMLHHQSRHGRPPTQAEIAAAAGLGSPNGAVCHIQCLIRKGYVRAHAKGTKRRFVAIR